MNISLTGNPKTMTAETGAAEALPVAEGAPTRETPTQGVANLTVTETSAQTGVAGVPIAEFEKAMTRTDGLGKLVDEALSKVPTKVIDKAIAMMLQKDYETKKATIDNMKPSEREIEMRKETQKRDEKKADERRAEKISAERQRDQMTADLLPGEKGLAKTLLDQIPIQA